MSSLSLRSHWEDWELRTSSLSRLSFRLEEDGVQPESGGAPGSGGFWFCAECRWDRNPRHRRVRARWNNSAAHHVFTALRLRFSPQLKVWFPHPFLAKVEPRLLPLPQILLHTCLSTLCPSHHRGEPGIRLPASGIHLHPDSETSARSPVSKHSFLLFLYVYFVCVFVYMSLRVETDPFE